MSAEPREPSFGSLMRGNLRVLGWVALWLIVAYALWRGLRWLFPDVSWLRIPQR